MDLVWIIALLAALPASLVALVRTVRTDGLGHREPPRSHPSEPGTRPGWPFTTP
ncbi:hypothetical protein [Cellulomonas phragmiteti]|uniref:Uncharacterized protein n=1 Tax=Cellulomonas phragmiteti TaxID=478780 RepID=A0ABQ4DLE1_9CELL|nr:hypothetical protein [Cellulomonas phragmiteti]GIG40151.1 hypothetical protein Cph01nite_19130 [Cellulomonas phragmiteti]